MYFSDVVAEQIEGKGKSLLTEYDFFLLSYAAYQKHTDGRVKIRNPPRSFDPTVARRTIRQLERRRLIVRDPDFKGEVWQSLRAPPIVSAEEAICLVDPFAYVAFLSALERHSLTNRSPKSLQMVTYGSPHWGRMRRQLMASELPTENLGQTVIMPVRIHNRAVVRRRPVDTFQTKEEGSTRIIRGTAIRISTIGQTFLDTITRPELCGGMRHVVEIWESHANSYQSEIIKKIDEDASPINKVRAGFLLERYAKTDHQTVRSWEKFAQRGGSRKLDPHSPYVPTFSEKWMLSINV